MFFHFVWEFIFLYFCILIASPVDFDEDEAIEEAVRRSLLEESVQSSQHSRYTCLACILLVMLHHPKTRSVWFSCVLVVAIILFVSKV